MSLKLRFAFLALGCAATLLLAQVATAATAITCIGEQTTQTTDGGITADKLWPAQLGTLLGAGYMVVNAVTKNGNTIMKGDCVTTASTMGPPNAVIIGPFAEHDYAAGITADQFQTAYFKVIDTYLALTPKPTVYVMTPPPPTFQYQAVNADYSVEENFASNIVKPAVLAAVTAKGVKLIDLSADMTLVPGAGDGHFTPAQHAEVAKDAAAVIMGAGSGGSGSGGSGAGGGSGMGAGGAPGAAGAASVAGASGTAAAGAASGGEAAAGTSAGGSASGGSATAGTGPTGTSGGSAGSVPTSAAGSGTVAGSSSNASQSSSNDSGGCNIGARENGSASVWLALTVFGFALRRRRAGA